MLTPMKVGMSMAMRLRRKPGMVSRYGRTKGAAA